MQIPFLNGEQAILYINKDAIQNTHRCALYVTQHSTAARRTKVIPRELVSNPVGLCKGMVFITKQPKLKDANTREQSASSGSQQSTANCLLQLALLPDSCFTLVPDNVSGVE